MWRTEKLPRHKRIKAGKDVEVRSHQKQLDALVAQLGNLYPGPGGAVAVVQEGIPRVRASWGYSNAERHIAFTPQSSFRICSITKQFTCALLLKCFPDPHVLDQDVRDFLPLLNEDAPRLMHLAHNQSGLRDYWAVGMLMGALPETPFSDDDARRIIQATRSLQFAPGTSYAYCNQNFRIIGDIIARRQNCDFGSVLQREIFQKVGMHSAFVAADTSALPDGGTGYEGREETGFLPARNRIFWTGDAGVAASLDDLIAWERYIDRTRLDSNGLYNRLSAPQYFNSGARAPYGFGLRHMIFAGRPATGHGGGLRGWHSFRLHIPQDRLSVIVLFNHMSDASGAAAKLAHVALGLAEDATQTSTKYARKATAQAVNYIDQTTGLAARMHKTTETTLLEYLYPPETCKNKSGGVNDPFQTRLDFKGGACKMNRPSEDRVISLEPLKPILAAKNTACHDVDGVYYCEEINAWLEICSTCTTAYAAFYGQLGKGQMTQLTRLSLDVFLMPCRRALDHAPPGDWTLQIMRISKNGPTGQIQEIRVGCWLARKLCYHRVNAIFDRTPRNPS